MNPLLNLPSNINQCLVWLCRDLTVAYKKIYHGNNEEEKLENFLITGQKISLRVIARIKALFRNYASTRREYFTLCLQFV